MALRADLGTLKPGVPAPNAYLRIEEMQLKVPATSETDLEAEVTVAVFVTKHVRQNGGEPIERRRFRLLVDDTTEPLRKRLYTQLKGEFPSAQDD